MQSSFDWGPSSCSEASSFEDEEEDEDEDEETEIEEVNEEEHEEEEEACLHEMHVQHACACIKTPDSVV